MLAYMDDATTEENLSRMEQAIGGVKSGEITSAGRDVILGPVEVRSGDSIGIFEGKVRCSCLVQGRGGPLAGRTNDRFNG